MNGLELKGLTKHFGSLRAVDGLDLSMAGGEVFGLLGPNGAGKTTTIRMIAGLLTPDGGTVSFGTASPDPRSWRRQVGLCPQEIVIWENLTCRENLVFMAGMYDIPNREAGRRADQLLGELALEDKHKALARTLSGGMKRRLNLALALVHRPPVLILDEPEAGLDSQSRVMVREFVRRQAGERLVILTTHDLAEAELMADRVAILDHGRLLACGTPGELCARSDSFESLDFQWEGGDAAAKAGKAIELLAAPDRVIAPPVRGETGGTVLTISLAAAVATLPALLLTLGEAHRPQDIRLRRTTLEDRFIQLTGRGIRE